MAFKQDNTFYDTPQIIGALEVSPPFKIDTSVPGVTYIGYISHPGVKDDEEAWHIMKVTSTGAGTTMEFSGGHRRAIFKWTDRTTITYSR